MISVCPRIRSLRRRAGFTLVEFTVSTVVLSGLTLMSSAAWKWLGAPLTEVQARSALIRESRAALAALAYDLGGSLPDAYHDELWRDRLNGVKGVNGSELWLCYEGNGNNGVPDWGV